ncbi:MAG TPA: acyl-CoA dehydrogenase family protein [Solirubrobacterales bacterium]|nr:acyl-CoA dehydrogenase family protein [Solirubrobacterales bacterium]
MDFGFSDEQQAIKDTAREMLGARSPLAKVREAAESRSYDEGLWSEIRELGWPGIAIAEEHGGQGLGTVELAILCEELGYACAATPFLSNAAAGLFVEHAGSNEQRERWLAGIASGEARGAAAFEPRSNDLVIDAEGAAVLVLNDGDQAVLAEPGEVRIEPVELIDATRSCARVAASGGEELPGDVESAADRAVVALAAELTGIAQRAMEIAIDYAKERQQFGRPIGAYQAVSHRCAQMLYDTEEARSLTYYAAWTADAEPETLPLACSMAKARASEAAWHVTNEALQTLGGIGFTWEHDLQFLLKRAKVGSELLGPARLHRERVASLFGLGAREREPAPVEA